MSKLDWNQMTLNKFLALTNKLYATSKWEGISSLRFAFASLIEWVFLISFHECIKCNPDIINILHIVRSISYFVRYCCGRDRIVVGFITTYAINAYHYCCEFESHSGQVYSVQYYVIKFVSDLRQVDGFLLVLRVLRFPPSIKLPAKI